MRQNFLPPILLPAGGTLVNSRPLSLCRRVSSAALGLLLCLAVAPAQAQRADSNVGEFAANVRQSVRPRLTVVISIDQFRADYLRRLTPFFLPPTQGKQVGGFRYLMTAGSYFIDARYAHFPTYTGPGHSIIMTGGYPYKTGIVSNDWFDPITHKGIYCVDDDTVTTVGPTSAPKKTVGPKNLHSTTVGDELKLATGGAARCVSIALKDRAAILLGGHTQDACLWFDQGTGKWISSTAYCKNGSLPDWAERLNAEAIPDKTLGTTWQPLPELTEQAMRNYVLAPDLPGSREPYEMGVTFPHKINEYLDANDPTKKRKNYAGFTLTPDANAFLFTTAERAVLAEKLGQNGTTPDILTLNLSTNDYVGHAFGPYSPEALDLTVRTDRQISEFLNFLDTHIPGGLRSVVFVVTADHGVVPIVENLQAQKIDAKRVLDSQIEAAIKRATDPFGAGPWIGTKTIDGVEVKYGGYVEPYIYLNPDAIKQAITDGKAASRAQIEAAIAEEVAQIPGIYACYTRSQILDNRLPRTDIAQHILNGFHPKISGSLVVVTEMLAVTDSGRPGPYATTHGTPYIYDTHVPILIAGPGIRSGVWADPVSPADIAPTLCALLGIEDPSACDGTILKSALR